MATTPGQLAHGWDELAYVMPETVFGTLEDVAGTGGFEFLSIDMGPVETAEHRDLRYKNGKRLADGVLTGKISPIDFTVRGLLMPSGAAGVAPDMGPLFENGFGTETVVGGTSVTYTFSDKPAAGISIVRGDGDLNWAEYGYGGVVQRILIEAGEEEAEVEFTGQFLGKSSVAACTTNVGVQLSAIATTIQLADGEQYKFIGVGQIVQDPAETGEQMLVTAVDYSTGIITVIRGHIGAATTHENGFTLQPYLPAQSLAAGTAPIGEHDGSYTLHGISVNPLKYSFEVQTGRRYRSFEKGSQRRRNVIAGRPDNPPTGTITLYADQVMLPLLGRANQAASSTLAFVEGTTAGLIMTINGGTTYLDVANIPLPDDDVGMFDVPVKFLDWDNATKPLNIVFT